ncbi:putative metal-dependent membrane protease [Acetobacter nitrogenifigens DSM 23921 = NBRC 105050]|uniref:Membrane protein n=1 Tax=Acetobacter nitrogenifigens DSM 23921 = NBRC 105050 TaxID=1120919 RepID=A0A511XAB7_9PROT|nr:putative metal-dependent membrane protease [Acetobacter nitrogenifigens DSM 23921 = NBRC 105050]GEN59907.1 membrane protein [Acetobacter nitrogenifigens DSM 23921 = NBRC 105050]
MYQKTHITDASGVIGPGHWQKLRILGWMLALLVSIMIELGLQSAIRSFVSTNPMIVLTAAFVTLALAYATYVALVRYGERRPLRELALRPALRELTGGITIGCGIMSVVVIGLYCMGIASIHPSNWSDWSHDIREALGTGFLEELLARLIIFRLLSCAFGLSAGVAISALLFGAAHLHNPSATILSAAAIAIEAGLLLSGFYIATGRIWVSVGAHAGWNFTLGAIFGAPVSGMPSQGSLLLTRFDPTAPVWLTGGAFGPEASILTVGAGLIVFTGTVIVGECLEKKNRGILSA